VNVLILGATGFIGSHICDLAVRNGWQVRILIRPGSKSNQITLPINVEIMHGDYKDKNIIERALYKIEVIFHFISTTIPKSSNENKELDIVENVIPLISLLDISVRSGVRKIIFSSSGGTIYGIPNKLPIDESHCTLPLTSYGIHKLTIEKYLNLYFYQHNLDYSVMRIANPYGERQSPTGGQGVISVFMNNCINNQIVEIWGDGSVIRDYIHVSDVANAAVLLAKLNPSEKIFNIGCGQGRSLNELVSLISKIVGKKLNVKYSQGRVIDVPVNILDITRAQTLLGWKPNVNINDGLTRTLEWFQSRNKNVTR